MSTETVEAAKFTFPDGSSEIMSIWPGLKASGETLVGIGMACLKPTPISAEIITIEVPSAEQ